MWMAEEAQVQSESGSLEVRAEARRSLRTAAASGDVRAVVSAARGGVVPATRDEAEAVAEIPTAYRSRTLWSEHRPQLRSQWMGDNECWSSCARPYSQREEQV